MIMHIIPPGSPPVPRALPSSCMKIQVLPHCANTECPTSTMTYEVYIPNKIARSVLRTVQGGLCITTVLASGLRLGLANGRHWQLMR